MQVEVCTGGHKTGVWTQNALAGWRCSCCLWISYLYFSCSALKQQIGWMCHKQIIFKVSLLCRWPQEAGWWETSDTCCRVTWKALISKFDTVIDPIKDKFIKRAGLLSWTGSGRCWNCAPNLNMNDGSDHKLSIIAQKTHIKVLIKPAQNWILLLFCKTTYYEFLFFMNKKISTWLECNSTSLPELGYKECECVD